MLFSFSSLQHFIVLGALVGLGSACEGDHHSHSHERELGKRLPPSTQLPVPTRPLQWGDLNIIHTTDSHGWLLGHQKAAFPEPNYSGDFGDFSSFVAHMKQIALERDVDLLLVDSGDLHDGTGLSDGFPPGGVDAHESNKFFDQLPYDVLAIGNHELYIYNNTLDMYKNFVPMFQGRYLSSNVNITVEQDGKAVSVPVGSRFAKFTSRKGKRITSLGVLYDFTGNDVNTTVQSVQDMVKETWFLDAIKDEPDLFLLVGHMPVSEDNWPAVHSAVRAIHPLTPIIILGGHSHIRDCNQLDGRSMSFESGRYMETVGWLSANLDAKGSTGNLTFSRRYLDPNRVTYEWHTQESNKTFDTFKGQSITQGLLDLATRFDLSFLYGVAPETYTLDRSPYPSNSSLLTLFAAEAMPFVLTLNNSRAGIPNFMITNSGSQRFDIYAGTFTKNDQLTASPFDDSFLYIPEVPLGVAKSVLTSLNGDDSANSRRSTLSKRAERVLTRREEMKNGGEAFRRWLEDMDKKASHEIRAATNLTLGYVTQDSCPGIGDDILHTPLPFFDTPDYISSNPPTGISDDTPIDFVFVDFIESDVIEILNQVQSNTTYSASDVAGLYSPVLADAVLGIYAQANWN